MLTRY